MNKIKYFLEYKLRDVGEGEGCIKTYILYSFTVFFAPYFFILILHQILTIFVIGSKHLGLTVAKIKIVTVTRGHALNTNDQHASGSVPKFELPENFLLHYTSGTGLTFSEDKNRV